MQEAQKRKRIRKIISFILSIIIGILIKGDLPEIFKIKPVTNKKEVSEVKNERISAFDIKVQTRELNNNNLKLIKFNYDNYQLDTLGKFSYIQDYYDGSYALTIVEGDPLKNEQLVSTLIINDGEYETVFDSFKMGNLIIKNKEQSYYYKYEDDIIKLYLLNIKTRHSELLYEFPARSVDYLPMFFRDNHNQIYFMLPTKEGDYTFYQNKDDKFELIASINSNKNNFFYYNINSIKIIDNYLYYQKFIEGRLVLLKFDLETEKEEKLYVIDVGNIFIASFDIKDDALLITYSYDYLDKDKNQQIASEIHLYKEGSVKIIDLKDELILNSRFLNNDRIVFSSKKEELFALTELDLKTNTKTLIELDGDYVDLPFNQYPYPNTIIFENYDNKYYQLDLSKALYR